MAIRRRRKKLTNLLSTLDRRVKGLELRPIDLLSANQAAFIQETAADAIDVIVSDSAPFQYKPIYKAYFYGNKVTGSGSQVELFFESDTGAGVGDRLQVSGLNGTSSVSLEISGDSFIAIREGSPDWDQEGRKTWQYTPSAQESNLSHSLVYKTNVAAPGSFSGAKSLSVRARIASYQATGSTVRINLTDAHKFKVDDILYVELGVENPIIFGIDGLFRLTAVEPTYVEYEISSPLAEPIGVTPVVTIIRYIYAVAHEYVREGATWIDSSGDSDVVYIWKDFRWVSFSSYVGDDGIAPAPVTNLSAETSTRGVNGIQAGVATVTLTWTNPTTNATGGPLDDLFGFDVWYRYSASDKWNKSGVVPGDDSEWTQDGFEVPKNVTFRVYAIDSGGLPSAPADITVATVPAAKEIKAPTPPQITQYLGTPRFEWNGLQQDFTTPPSDAYEVEVHLSTINGFSITDGAFPAGSFYGKFSAIPGGYLLVNANDLTDGAAYYVRFVLTDIYGNKEASQQGTFTAKVSKVVTFDLLDIGTLNGQLITGLGIQTGQNVAGGFGDQSGLILDTNGLRAYNNGGAQTVNIDANTGAVSLTGSINISGYAKTSDLTTAINNLPDNSLSTQDIINAINSSGAGSINETVVSPNGIVTPIVAANTFIALGSSRDILAAGTTISGSKITTGTIDASKVTVSNINADNIKAGTITGTSLQTAASGKRILISQVSNSIVVYGNNGSEVGRIQAAINAGVFTLSGTGSAGISIGLVSTQINGGLGTVGTSSNITAGGRCGQVVFSSLGTTSSVGRSTTFETQGLFGPAASDARLKENVIELENSLDLINQLRPVKFQFITEENGPVSYGLIAQEVQPLFDDNDNVVNEMIVGDPEEGEDNTTYLSIEYDAFIAPLIKAVQELSEKNDALEARLEALEGN